MPDDTARPEEDRPRPPGPGQPGFGDGTATDLDTPSEPGGWSDRTRFFVWAGVALAGIVAVIVVAAFLPNTSPPTPAATTATPTTTAATTPTRPTPPIPGAVITAFHVIDDVTCSGPQASVPVSWSTRDAQSVTFQVDNAPVSAGAGYPLSGVGSVPVPCDGGGHQVVLVAAGAGAPALLARHVNTSGTPPPPTAPSIAGFDLLEDVPCTGATAAVPAAWTTQNAQAVSFSVDGQPLPAAAGYPVSGAGNVAVPCDGNAHVVTLTATGTGSPAALSRTVNTTVTPSGATTTTAVAPSTTAPPSTLAPTTVVPPTTG